MNNNNLSHFTKNMFFKNIKKKIKNISLKKINKHLPKVINFYRIYVYTKLYFLICELKNKNKLFIFELANCYISKIFFIKYSIIYWIINKFFFYLTKSQSSLNWFLGLYLFKFKFIFLLLLYFYKKIYFMFIEWYNILIKKNELTKKKWEKQFFFYWNLNFLINSFHKHYNKETKIDLLLFNNNNNNIKYYADIIINFLIKKSDYDNNEVFKNLNYKKNYNLSNKLFTTNIIFGSFYYYHLLINRNYFLVQHIFFKNYMKFVFDKFLSFFNMNFFLRLSHVRLKRPLTLVSKKIKKNKFRFFYNNIFVVKKDKSSFSFYKDDKYINILNISKFLLYYKNKFFRNWNFSKIYTNKLFIDNSYTDYINYKLFFNLPFKNKNIYINKFELLNNKKYICSSSFFNKNNFIQAKKDNINIIF